MRAATILAHPDDEALWCGGLISATSHRVQWDCICCTIPYQDPIRAFKFFKVCSILGARAILLPWTETTARDPLPKASLAAVEEFIRSEGQYDAFITHGESGEYGHKHHRQLGEFVANNVPPEKLMRIAYGNPVRDQKPTWYKMSAQYWEVKRRAILAYDHPQPNGQGETKGEALLARYGGTFDLQEEAYTNMMDL